MVVTDDGPQICEGVDQRDVYTATGAADAQRTAFSHFPDELPAKHLSARSCTFEDGFTLGGAEQHSHFFERAEQHSDAGENLLCVPYRVEDPRTVIVVSEYIKQIDGGLVAYLLR